MVKVSVITVSYNSAKTIRDTIESVVNQTYKNIEYVIVDGVSTDGTVEIIKEYADKYPFIKYISEKDSGIYNAMNKGLKMVTGDLIGIVNSDDHYELDTVENVVAQIPKEDTYIIYGMVRMIKNGKEESISIFSPDFLSERMMLHPACFVSKAVYDKYGLFDETYRMASDYDLFLRYSKHSDISFIPLYKVLSNFSVEGVSNTYAALKEYYEVRYKHGCISKKEYTKEMAKFYIKKILLNR